MNIPATVIVCRSTEQIQEDDICEAHTELSKMLRLTCNGCYLYRGNRRAALERLKALCEAYITGSGPAPDRIFHRIFLSAQL